MISAIQMALTQANSWNTPKSLCLATLFLKCGATFTTAQMGSSTWITWQHYESISWFRNRLSIFPSKPAPSQICLETPPAQGYNSACISGSSSCPPPTPTIPQVLALCSLPIFIVSFVFHLHHCASSLELYATSSEDGKSLLALFLF